MKRHGPKYGYKVWAKMPFLSETEVSLFFDTVNRHREMAFARKEVARVLKKNQSVAKRNHTTDRAAEINKAFWHA